MPSYCSCLSVTNYYDFIIISQAQFLGFNPFCCRFGVLGKTYTHWTLFVVVATIFYCYFSIMVRYLCTGIHGENEQEREIEKWASERKSSKTINDNTLDDITHSCAIENRPSETFFFHLCFFSMNSIQYLSWHTERA